MKATAKVLQFPILPHFEPTEEQLALVDAIDIMSEYLVPPPIEAKEALARILVLPQIAMRLGTVIDCTVPIEDAGNALNQVAATLARYYLELSPADEACSELQQLFNSAPVVEIYDTVMARRLGGIRDADQWH